MTKEQIEMIGLIGVLPVMGDFLENLDEKKMFKRRLKIKAKNLLAQIRSFDEEIMNEASIEAGEQQVNIQIAFRQWLRTAQNTEND
jgi:hypothetical protein